MWYWLGKFESLLFYIPFLMYASLRRIPYSTRCRSCGRWLWRWEDCWNSLCERCAQEEVTTNEEGFYDKVYSRVALDAHSSVHEHLYRAVEESMGFGKILEVGCGRGYMLSRLQSPQRELYGIDISGAAAKIAKAHTTEASTFAADVRKLPFKSNCFDYLICLEVLEHIEGDEAIKECLRVLKPGGKALFSVPNMKGVGGRIAGHVRFFTFASSLEYVRQAGFEITSARKMGLYIPILTYSLSMLSLATNKNIPLNHPVGISVPEFLAIAFFIECRKPLFDTQLGLNSG